MCDINDSYIGILLGRRGDTINACTMSVIIRPALLSDLEVITQSNIAMAFETERGKILDKASKVGKIILVYPYVT